MSDSTLQLQLDPKIAGAMVHIGYDQPPTIDDGGDVQGDWDERVTNTEGYTAFLRVNRGPAFLLVRAPGYLAQGLVVDMPHDELVTIPLTRGGGGGGEAAHVLSRLRATKMGFVNAQNQRVPIAGVSAFMHFERFLRGEDIDPLLRQVQDLGCNCLRVFGMAHYIPVNAGRPPFTPQDFGNAYFDRQPEFCAHVAGFGQHVYWSVFPDGNMILSGIDQQRPFFDREVETLKRSANTFGELTNEQDAHSFNTIDPSKVNRPSGIAFNSGSYGEIGGRQPYPWDFIDYHTPRRWDPPTAIKDSCVVDHPDYLAGLGVLLGEPDRFGSNGNGNAEQARQQAGAARETAIGHIFHSANGRESQLYDDQTLAIARVWFKAAIGSLP